MNKRVAMDIETFTNIMTVMMLVLYLGAYDLSFLNRRRA
jgi:hypothetical protein